ncbi:hypothetical protein ACHQM5_007038 [Ranunculus cassubicifolius]
MMDAEEGWRLLKLRDLFQRLIAISKWKASLIKFTCLSVVSFASYFVLLNWLASGLLVVRGTLYYVVIDVLGFVAVLITWMELDSVWSLGAAMSFEKQGLKAWTMSTFFREGRRLSGFLMMILHFGWCFSTGFARIFMGDDSKQVVYSGIIDAVLYVSLIWGKVI